MPRTTAAGEAHAALLTELGFPLDVVESAAQSVDEGLFELEPSPELVSRTVKACQAACLPDEAKAVRPSRHAEAMHEEVMIAAYTLMVSELVKVAAGKPVLASAGRLISECLATVGFVHETRKRPMMVLDNHNVVVPRWWSSDSGFLAVRDTLATVNQAAFKVHASPAAVIMVLKPAFESYEEVDFRSLCNVFNEKSDVWLLPYERAGLYKNCGALVFAGDRCAMTLEERCETPGAAFGSFRETWGQSVDELWKTIETMTSRVSTTRHRAGVWTQPGDDAPIRALVREVIETGEAVRLVD